MALNNIVGFDYSKLILVSLLLRSKNRARRCSYPNDTWLDSFRELPRGNHSLTTEPTHFKLSELSVEPPRNFVRQTMYSDFKTPTKTRPTTNVGFLTYPDGTRTMSTSSPTPVLLPSPVVSSDPSSQVTPSFPCLTPYRTFGHPISPSSSGSNWYSIRRLPVPSVSPQIS